MTGRNPWDPGGSLSGYNGATRLARLTNYQFRHMHELVLRTKYAAQEFHAFVPNFVYKTRRLIPPTISFRAWEDRPAYYSSTSMSVKQGCTGARWQSVGNPYLDWYRRIRRVFNEPSESDPFNREDSTHWLEDDNKYGKYKYSYRKSGENVKGTLFKKCTPYSVGEFRFTDIQGAFVELIDYDVPNDHPGDTLEHSYCHGVSHEIPMNIRVVAHDLGDYLLSDDNSSAPTAIPLKVQPLIEETNNKILKKLGKSDIEVLMTLSEANRTLEMLTSSFGRLVNSLHALKRADVVGVATALGRKPKFNRRKTQKGDTIYEAVSSTSSLWLEYNFGWRQLVQDIYGAISALKEYLAKRPIIGVCKSGKHAEVLDFDFIKDDRHHKGQVSCDVTTLVYYTVSDEFLRTLNNIGILNPGYFIWDKIPYSFVVDWAFPVADFLSSFTATVGLQFLTGCHSIKQRADVTTFINPIINLSTKDDLVEQSPNISGLRDGGAKSPGLTMRWDRERYISQGDFFHRIALTDFPKHTFLVRNPLRVFTGITSLALILKNLKGN